MNGVEVTWLAVPAVVICTGWWSWSRNRMAWHGWRAGATFVALTTITTNAVMLTALALVALLTRPVVAINYERVGDALACLGVALCATSAVAAVVGRGRFRWLIIPAAVIQCDAWLMVFVAVHAY